MKAKYLTFFLALFPILALANPNLAGPDLSFLAPIILFVGIGFSSAPYAIIFIVIFILCKKNGKQLDLWLYMPLAGILTLVAGYFTCDLLTRYIFY